MKLSRLMQLVFVSGNLLLAMPGLAAALPSSSPEAPVALCGGNKSEKTEKDSKGDKDKKDKEKGDSDKGDSEQPAAT